MVGLQYRGQGYDVEPIPVEMVKSNIVGKYRGQSYTFAYPKHIPVPQIVSNLKYRGVAYQNNEAGAIASIPPTEFWRSVTAPTVRTSSITMRQVRKAEVSRIHRENIQRRLQHRLEVARSKGDERLIHQLEQEMRQFV
jgi:hypothetical protein